MSTAQKPPAAVFVPLALVVDDPLAPRVLAAWKVLGLVRHDDGNAGAIADLLGTTVLQVMETLRRCERAGLLQDGDISEQANNWVANTVAAKVGLRKRKPAP